MPPALVIDTGNTAVITKVKVDEAGETEGLDLAIHGEAAYLEGI